MAVVRINAIEVPEGMGERIEQMFAKRLGTVDLEPGFLGFELLRPSGENERRYYVVTRWETDEAFDNWVNSENFQHGHRGAEGAGQQGPPVSSGAELLSFDVVLSSQPHG